MQGISALIKINYALIYFTNIIHFMHYKKLTHFNLIITLTFYANKKYAIKFIST